MDIGNIRKSALSELEKAGTADEIERLRVKYLGRKGEVTALLRSLKDLPIKERRSIGPKMQTLQKDLEEAINEKLKSCKLQAASYGLDLTAPGTRIERGHLHPLTIAEREMRRIFLGMNFSVVDGPEVESEYYNFAALNFPPDHPARDVHDTFWIKTRINADSEIRADKRGYNIREDQRDDPRKSALLLRTHVSGIQVHYLESHEPPFQIIYPGRCFRFEATDASHETNFVQFEGMVVGRNITLANFKFVVEEFLKKYLGTDIEFRYRSAYFPFVEPGLEVVVKYRGKWMELMGAGMVHPRVFEYGHRNPKDWQGFAFGMGLDRLALVKYKVPDIRLFYSGDLRFIKQF